MPSEFLLLIIEYFRLNCRRSKKKYDIDGKAELIPTDGQVEVVETADSYNSDSDSDSDSDDSDSDDDK